MYVWKVFYWSYDPDSGLTYIEDILYFLAKDKKSAKRLAECRQEEDKELEDCSLTFEVVRVENLNDWFDVLDQLKIGIEDELAMLKQELDSIKQGG